MSENLKKPDSVLEEMELRYVLRTPAEWQVYTDQLRLEIRVLKERLAKHEANAKLIAAAPDLYAALKDLLKVLPIYLNCDDFHHSAKDRHFDNERCPPQIKYDQVISNAYLALAKVEE